MISHYLQVLLDPVAKKDEGGKIFVRDAFSINTIMICMTLKFEYFFIRGSLLLKYTIPRCGFEGDLSTSPGGWNPFSPASRRLKTFFPIEPYSFK